MVVGTLHKLTRGSGEKFFKTVKFFGFDNENRY